MSARRLLAISLVLLLAPPTWAQTGFEIGARVTVVNTKKLKVRSAPNSTSILGTQPSGATGTIVGGTGALVGGYHWWQVNFDTGVDGYAPQENLRVTSPPPRTVSIDSFTATPTTITAGESATLTWETSNATAVTLNGVPVPADGTLTVSPTTTTDYDLLADSVSGRITLTVTQPPPPPPPPPPTVTIDSFTVLPTTITAGEWAILTWETSNATAVTLNGVPVAADGTLTVSPTTTTDYDLLADSVSRRITLTVTPPPPPPTVTIDSFTAAPTTITAGDSATLTWETSNATAVTLNGATVPVDGTLTVSPTTTTDYDLLADSVSRRITLTVTPPPPPPPPTVSIDSFTALPTTITAGQSATLTWETSNATAVTLNGVPVPADGTLTVSPTTTTDYDLLADSVSRRISLTVTAPPPPPPTTSIDSFTALPTTITAGQSATLTWETSNATAVTLNGATVPADGTLTVSPTTTTDYNLLADSVSRRITLTVLMTPPPPPGEQTPGTWLKLVFPTQEIYQPALGGDQSIAEGQPGAAYTNCPRPIQTNGAGIIRSFSGVLIANGDLLVIGGGHAGHPGNDLQTIDYVNAARTYPFVPECPPAYNPDGTPNSTWRGIGGGAVMTGGLSPTGKPWVQHMYMNHVWDSIRGRYLVINGNGLMAYTLPTAGYPEGQWALLVGKNKYANEVIWGSSGGIIFDPVRDSVWMFVSTAGNGGARGIYEYLFEPGGAVITKRYVRAWPVTEGTCWGCSNLITAMYAGERREAILMVTPSSTTSSVPRNQLWRFNLATETLTRDFSWVPGTSQYDEVFAVDDTRARLITRLPGQTWLMLATGAWIQNDDDGGTWTWLAMPGAPNLAWWTFACDPDSVYCVGLSARSAYGGVGTSSGGISDVWRYRRP